MSVAIITRLAREGVKPKRDLIFAGVADEEAGCRHGSLWLCENHPDLVRSEFAIGEVSCPAVYFEEASSINFQRSVRYGLGVLATGLQGLLHRSGIARQALFEADGRRLEV